MSDQVRKTIKVDYLARVEGEVAIHISTKGKELQDVKLKIFEPPRFFEAFLRGRGYQEAPDITARICGICPVAYQMSAIKAIERAFSMEVDHLVRRLRRLLYCGEWIESHALHIFMLHAPDFLGLPDAMTMAQKNKKWVAAGLKIKKAGNRILSHLGGREIHPINIKVGGFYHIPPKSTWAELSHDLHHALGLAWEAYDWLSGFSYPDAEFHYNFVSLKNESEYPMNEGTLMSSQGLPIDDRDFESHFQEVHVEHSNALHCQTIDGASYLTGPLARFHHNFDRLPNRIRMAAIDSGLGESCSNPYRSIQVRTLEMIYAMEEAIAIIDQISDDTSSIKALEPTVEKSKGWGITEAPRGILYHAYELSELGIIKDAKIVPPTSQNQKRIEDDLKEVIQQNIDLSDDRLRHLCEQTIRNYDPCISCATHFLKLTRESL